jgi:hypothetical protein
MLNDRLATAMAKRVVVIAKTIFPNLIKQTKENISEQLIFQLFFCSLTAVVVDDIDFSKTLQLLGVNLL